MATYARVADLTSWVPNSMVRVMVLKKWKKVGGKGVEGLDVIVVDEEVSLLSLCTESHIFISSTIFNDCVFTQTSLQMNCHLGHEDTGVRNVGSTRFDV